MRSSKFKIQNLSVIVFLVVSFLFLIPAQTQAGLVPCGASQDDPDTDGIFEDQPCQFCHIFVLINNIISFILTRLVPIAAGLMLIIGGFYFLIAGPDPGKVNQAKSIIFAVVIGIVVIFAAWVFLNTFLTTIGVATWTGLDNWWQITCS